MIIWSGLGIIIPIIWGILYWVIGLFFGDHLIDTYLHFSSSFLLTAVIWFGLSKKTKSNLIKVKEAEELLANPEALNEKAMKKAKAQLLTKKSSEQFHNSSLFFIHTKWWTYILLLLSVILIILQIVNWL